MLSSTGGTFTENPEINTTYYQRTPQVGNPVFQPNGGEYTNSVSVTISNVTAGATIYYTTDGTEPTTNSTPYTAAITLNTLGITTVKAIAVMSGLNDSAVVSADYTIVSGEPELDAAIKWRLNRGTGTYFAQLRINCVCGNVDEISDLRFVFADRINDGKGYAQLWNSPSRATVAETMSLENGDEARYVALDAHEIDAVSGAIFGMSDATLSAAQATSVPASERLIELYVRKRVSPVTGNESAAEVDNFLGYITWKWEGNSYWLPVAESSSFTLMRSVMAAPPSVMSINFASGLNVAPAAGLAGECAITDFTVEGDVVQGRFEISALLGENRIAVETLGSNARIIVYGAKTLGGTFTELEGVEVDLAHGTFKSASHGCNFFKVALSIRDIVE